MKAFIQTNKNGEFYNVNAFIANEGFLHFGFETKKYIDVDLLKAFGQDVETIIDYNLKDIK